MRNVTKVVVHVCTALTALALASCEVIASTAGQDISSGTEWLSLTPSVPVDDGYGVRTATLTLGFSRAIDGLTSKTSPKDLAKIFAFEFDPPDGAADFELTGVEKVAEAVYRLTVVNVPLSGVATITVNRPGITPPVRLWTVPEGVSTSRWSRNQNPLKDRRTYYVSQNGAGDYDGRDWDNAVNRYKLYDVLLKAKKLTKATPGTPIIVYVSAGTYTAWFALSDYLPPPYSYVDDADGQEAATFTLGNSVKVYGGFPDGSTGTVSSGDMTERLARFNTDGSGLGFGAIKPAAAACETILSGDFREDDSGAVFDAIAGTVPRNFSNNAYHVVTIAAGTTAEARLDGFTVKGGYSHVNGGGIYSYADHGAPSSPVLANLTIAGNKSESGGGIANSLSSPVLSNVTIAGNTATGNGGGGMYNINESSPILSNVTITGNTATGYGGGGIYNINASPVLTNVIIAGNTASNGGGGIYNFNASPVLTNVTIAGNTASNTDGGGIYNSFTSLTLTNVTIAGNSAATGGGIYNEFSTVNIRNSIVWGNTATEGTNVCNNTSYGGVITTWSHSLVAGSGGSSGPWNTAFGTDDGNNIDSAADPFVSSVPASSAPTKAGNYRLGGAVGVNGGNNAPTVPDGWLADIMGDWATYYNNLTDLDGLTRKMNGTIDMGAYEKQ